MQQLDDCVTIPYPSLKTWGVFYAQWTTRLIKALGPHHSEMDREDAVDAAFVKLMARSREDFPHHPDTERGWYNCILWQSKGALSHLHESRSIREKHHQLAMDERLREGIGITTNNLYAFRFRIERLLAAKGRDLFRQKQRQAFLMAA